MSENVVVYFLRLENARGSSGCLEPARPLLPFMTAREDGRRVKGEGRSLPQFIGAINDGCYAFGNRGVRPVSLYQKLAKAKPYSGCLWDGDDRATAGMGSLMNVLKRSGFMVRAQERAALIRSTFVAFPSVAGR